MLNNDKITTDLTKYHSMTWGSSALVSKYNISNLAVLHRMLQGTGANIYLAALTGDSTKVEPGRGRHAHLARNGLEVHLQMAVIFSSCPQVK